jgi:hypothetical protein
MSPRDGSGQYTQPFPNVVEGTTIESAVFNGNTADVAIDLNSPRPISSGGTGANNAVDARFNMGAEAAAQLVTNYDSHLWYPGSFRSAITATGMPVAGHAFAGWCYIGEPLANPPTNQNVVVHAFDLDALAGTYLLYSRQKKAGVWSDWSITTTEDNQAGARQAIYAAPFDALSYNGMQINGSFDVSQEFAYSTTVTGPYPADGWSAICSTPFIRGRIQYAPAGFLYSLQVGPVTTAVSAPAAGDHCICAQAIEGYRILRMQWGLSSAIPLTLGFWVLSTRNATYSGSVRNANSDRSYVFPITLTANVWTYKTVTIPGCTSGTWYVDNTAGIQIAFTTMSGSSYTTATANTWQTGNYVALAGSTNMAEDTVNSFYVTGLVVLPGIEAPTAARSALIMRPYDQELAMCQRYFQIFKGSLNFTTFGTGVVQSATAFDRVNAVTRVIMRAAPTIGFSGDPFLIFDGSALIAVTSITINECTPYSLSFAGTVASGLTAGRPAILMLSTGSSLIFDARL